MATAGWAQRRLHATATPANITSVNANLDLGGNDKSEVATQATSQPFEVTAGTSVPIHFGYVDNNSTLTGGGSAANTVTITCKVLIENSATLVPVSAGAASSVQTVVGFNGNTLQGFFFTFTPSQSGTVRLYIEMKVVVTATSSVISLFNSDVSGETIPATMAANDSTQGYVRLGCNVSTIAQSGASPYYYPTTITNTVTLNKTAMTDASHTLAVSWQDHLAAQFISTTINLSGASSASGAGLAVTPANAFPAAAESVGLVFTPANSPLSGLPWVHFGAVPAGWTGTQDANFNFVTVSKAGVFTADPRLQVHAHSQKVPTLVVDFPGVGTFVDDTSFIISSDLFYGWCWAGDKGGTARNAITCTMHLADTTVATPGAGGAGDHNGTLLTTAPTNLLSAENSSFEAGTLGTFVVGTGSAVNSTDFARDGVASVKLSSSGGSSINLPTGLNGIAVSGTTQYTALVSVRSAVTARSHTLTVNWYTSAGTFISASTASANDAAGSWTQINVTATSPGTAAFASITVSNAAPNGDIHYVDEVSFAAGASTTWGPGGQVNGWSPSTTPFLFTPSAPAGHWHYWCETATDGTSTWTRANSYLINVSDILDTQGAYTGLNGVNFVSAYRGNLQVLTVGKLWTGSTNIMPDSSATPPARLPKPGDRILFKLVLKKDKTGVANFTSYRQDLGLAPNIKIKRLDEVTGVEVFYAGTSDTVGVAMTADLSSVYAAGQYTIWYYIWDTSADAAAPIPEDTYIAGVAAFVDGGASYAEASVEVTVDTPVYNFDPVAYATGGGVLSYVGNSGQGPVGVQGPQGTQGTQGIQGAQGIPGPPGSTPRGVYDVKSYGAVGDGTTDDTTAIRTAYNTAVAQGGGTLYFPPGTYACTNHANGMVFTNSYIKFSGAGRGQSILKNTGAVGDVGSRTMITLKDCQYVAIEHLSMTHVNTALGSGDAGVINLQSVQHCRIEAVEAYGNAAGGGIGVGLSGTLTRNSDVVFKNCIIRDGQPDGFHFGGTSDGLCEGCIVENIGDDAFAVTTDGGSVDYYCDNILFTGNVARNPGASGFDISGGLRIVITGNAVYNSSTWGALLQTGGAYGQDLTDCVIADNVFVGCGKGSNPRGWTDPPMGLYMRIAGGGTSVIDRVKIQNNIFRDCYNRGISADAAGGSRIRNLDITDNWIHTTTVPANTPVGKDAGGSYNGLFINGCGDVQIERNRIEASWDGGISLQSAIGAIKMEENIVRDCNKSAVVNRSAYSIFGGASPLEVYHNVVLDPNSLLAFGFSFGAGQQSVGIFKDNYQPSALANFQAPSPPIFVVATVTSLPAATSTNAGQMVILASGGNAPDRLFISKKNHAGTYFWELVATSSGGDFTTGDFPNQRMTAVDGSGNQRGDKILLQGDTGFGIDANFNFVAFKQSGKNFRFINQNSSDATQPHGEGGNSSVALEIGTGGDMFLPNIQTQAAGARTLAGYKKETILGTTQWVPFYN